MNLMVSTQLLSVNYNTIIIGNNGLNYCFYSYFMSSYFINIYNIHAYSDVLKCMDLRVYFIIIFRRGMVFQFPPFMFDYNIVLFIVL